MVLLPQYAATRRAAKFESLRKVRSVDKPDRAVLQIVDFLFLLSILWIAHIISEVAILFSRIHF